MSWPAPVNLTDVDNQPLASRMSGWTLVILLTVAVFGGFVALGLRRLIVAWQRRARAFGPPESSEDGDLKTKRNLDTALSELRMLREALPATSELRVERRKLIGVPPNGKERRKPRQR